MSQTITARAVRRRLVRRGKLDPQNKNSGWKSSDGLIHDSWGRVYHPTKGFRAMNCSAEIKR